jgi:hypothetical protein
MAARPEDQATTTRVASFDRLDLTSYNPELLEIPPTAP